MWELEKKEFSIMYEYLWWINFIFNISGFGRVQLHVFSIDEKWSTI